jgi:DNA-binding response OmpR family regulator
LIVGNTRSGDGVTMAVRSSTKRILVVDDDAASRSRLRRILQAAGYEVIAAPDARAGAHQIDLVISSVAMPNAEEMIQALRAERRQLKIIATAAALDANTLRAADLLGAQAVLTKPFVAATVLQRVRELLRALPAPYVSSEEAPLWRISAPHVPK